MGLTKQSTGRKVTEFDIKKTSSDGAIVALAGNPNVGKSTVFNALTGMHQHTGNWPRKTVGSSWGTFTFENNAYTLVDIPGTYSLVPHSAEEEIARDFLCFSECDAVVIVCDATCLARNLNLVLQTMEISSRVVLCVNLMDEAKRKHICVNCQKLASLLGVPVVPTSARQGKGLDALMKAIEEVCQSPPTPKQVAYRPEIEEAISMIEPFASLVTDRLPARWLSIKLLDSETGFLNSIQQFLGFSPLENKNLNDALNRAKKLLTFKGYNTTRLRDALVSDVFNAAEAITKDAVCARELYDRHQLHADRLLTGKLTGIPVMILLLLFVLWLTVTGANYPSSLLSSFLLGLEEPLAGLCRAMHLPVWLQGALVSGVYRVLAWVVSVMLPPMAIFFPLFTLLEDLGYLPRVAFNLDHSLKKCCACGKQARTMCMGFGCNAAGVIGCRIIDSPRERLIAILTNSFVPCNGRFPTLISIITMFFITGATGILSSVYAAILLTALILLGIAMTLASSWILSKTVLKGVPSSFTLELPPYRRPQVGKVLIRSVFDRTLFVLGRAVTVAAPAGLVIYAMANISVAGSTLLAHTAAMLDPVAKIIGLDGVLLMAFILGFPANEIVMPIAIMAYMSESTLTEFNNLVALKVLLIDNGWTWLTAACTMIFSLMHWPCSTTVLSIKKETGSWRWTLVAFLLPTAVGALLCFLLTTAVRLVSL